MTDQPEAHTQSPRAPQDAPEGEAGEQGNPSNRELIQRFNTLQAVKPCFTVPKIKYAMTKNMTRIEQALKPFHRADEELRGEFGISGQEPLRTKDGEPREGIDQEFYDRRQGLLGEEGDPYDEYNVSDRFLDKEEGRMRDGSRGLPEGAISPIMWLFSE